VFADVEFSAVANKCAAIFGVGIERPRGRTKGARHFFQEMAMLGRRRMSIVLTAFNAVIARLSVRADRFGKNRLSDRWHTPYIM
jgi:hypothetical protein